MKADKIRNIRIPFICQKFENIFFTKNVFSLLLPNNLTFVTYLKLNIQNVNRKLGNYLCLIFVRYIHMRDFHDKIHNFLEWRRRHYDAQKIQLCKQQKIKKYSIYKTLQKSPSQILGLMNSLAIASILRKKIIFTEDDIKRWDPSN